MTEPATVAARAAAIELLLLDVDGVLTDGLVIYADSGEQIKAFDVKDGTGIRWLMRAGVKVGLLTGRQSMALKHRAENLGISMVYQDVKVKLPVFESILADLDLTPEKVAYMGDDLVDLPVMTRVGLALCPADAERLVQEAAHWVVPRPGGRGAVRLACEAILRARGKWDEITARYHG
jgi:3-deoxy-D-manno-octulosonate 8-phosphate phosphatase (KDO 8-P phosphatase)